MAYYIAIKSGTGYVILPEAFEIRSNAERFARRHGWEGYFIATESQRLTIEANQYLGGDSDEMQTSASYPGVTWMKEEGIPWMKSLRPKKKKR